MLVRVGVLHLFPVARVAVGGGHLFGSALVWLAVDVRNNIGYNIDRWQILAAKVWQIKALAYDLKVFKLNNRECNLLAV